MSLAIGFINNTHSSISKETKENSAKIRRRNIFCLIIDFLRDEGLFETVECLNTEAHLTNDYQVCDNIDLDIILQDYSNYYYLKFNKQPMICKRTKDGDGERELKPCSNMDGKKYKNKLRKNNSKENIILNDGGAKKQLEDPFIIKQLKDRGDANFVQNNTTFNYIDANSGETKPFSKFLSEIPSDQKEIAEAIYQTTKAKHCGVSWDDIKGLDNAKVALREAAIFPLKYPELFSDLATPWKGILLYGPPGSGKTLLAKALACEFTRTFFNISASLILSKWRGDSEKHIKLVFDMARYFAPSIIFLDEFEALASKRDSPTEHEASRRLKSEVLIELDGLGRTTENILFLTTSNLPWEIDPAILRRLEKRMYIPLPNTESRKSMFKSYLEKLNFDESKMDLNRLSDMTEGYSGSDIRVICKEAAMISVRKYLIVAETKGSHTHEKICHADLESAIKKIKPSAKLLSEKYQCWAESMGAE